MDDYSIEKRGKPLKQGGENKMLPIKPERIIMPTGAFGETGSGKTHQTKLEAYFYTQTIPNLKNGRKVLIVDPNGEYGYDPNSPIKHVVINTISLHHVKDFTNVMICRINMKGWTNEQKKVGALHAARTFRNGLLIVDDIDSFAVFDQSEDFISSIMGGRHKGTDLTLCHQSLDMGTRIFFRNRPAIRLHAQSSTPSIIKSKCSSYWDVLQIAENIVNYQYEIRNKRFFVTINTRDKLIYGCSDKQCFVNACKKFLLDNPGLVKTAASELIAYNKIQPGKLNKSEIHQAATTYMLRKLDVYHTYDKYH